MHWWQLPFSSLSKPQSDDDIAISGAGLFPSRRCRGKLAKNDFEECRSQHSRSRSSPALPQPLPLPESVPREPKLAPARCHNFPLPSPGGGRSRRGECGEERGRRTVEGLGLDEQLKRLVGENTRTSVEQSEIRLSRKPPVKHSEEMSSYCCNTIIQKSAPNSPVSGSPYSDTSTTNYMSPPPPSICHVLSTPEMPHSIVHTLPLPPGTEMSPLPTLGSSNSSTSNLLRASMSLSPTPISTLVAKLELPGVKHASPISQVVDKPEPMPSRSQWQKGKLIGKGTFGSVYVVSNRETGALCAMKEVEILPEDLKSQECMRQLEQEIKVLSNLKHPNIVQYYGSEIVGDKFYIYLEYVHPGSINKFIHDHCAAITETVVRNFTRHILCGLAYLHSTKTIHRDIKGANLLVDAHGVVKLADFGMAKHLSGDVANLSLKGSPYWLAPELLQPVMPKDASADLALAVDIWSLGCTIVEMINGKPPWSDYEGAAAMFKVLKESPPIPETLSEDGKDFLHCCFRRNPGDRPTAIKLLDHPFVNCNQSVKEMQFRRGQSCHKFNPVPLIKNKKGKLAIK